MMTNNTKMMNDMELDNVTGGAFWTASPNHSEATLQGMGITLKNAVNASSDAAGIVEQPAISFLRTDSMR